MRMDKNLFQKAKENHLDQFQIMEISNNDLTIETFNNQLNKFITSMTTTYLVSAIYQEKKVQITTESLSDTIIDSLKEQSQYLDITTNKTRIKKEPIKEERTYHLNTTNTITNQMLNLANLKKQYKNLKEINSYYTESIIQRKITTEESELYDIKKETSFDIEVVVNENNKNSTAYNTKIITDNSPIDMESIAKKTIQNAIDKLNFKEIKSGNYQVILTSRVMGSILNKFTSLFSADSLQKDTSLLVGKQNTQVFSNKITIVEDPINPNLPGKRLFDNAGTHTYYKEIIQNGIFKQPLYDEKTASVDKVQSTGNDYGEISPRNMYIKPGNKPLEELIKSVKNGILIDTVGGLHAGINPINGDISIQSEGYYIKDGNIQYATKLFVLSTNIMDILNNVIEISNHLEYYLPTTSSPDVLLDNIKISK